MARVLGTASLSAPLPFSIGLATQLAASALAGFIAHKLGFLEMAHHLRLGKREWEEVPLSGRLRPAMPIVTERELLLRDPVIAEGTSQHALQSLGEGGWQCLKPVGACMSHFVHHAFS